MIDAHAHLSDPRLTPDVEKLVGRLRSAGMKRVVLGGVDAAEWDMQLKLKSMFADFVSPVIGIHPWTVRDRDESYLESALERLKLVIDNAVALGEVGLDFHPKRTAEQLEKQSRWCYRQLELAQELKKPVVLHVVHAHDVMQNTLKKIRLQTAMVHGFRGNLETAKFYLDRGYVLSLGSRSFKGLTPEDFSWLPRDQFVLESDAPAYRADVSNIEKVCRDWTEALAEAARFLSNVWSFSSDEVWSLAENNLLRFLASSKDTWRSI